MAEKQKPGVPIVARAMFGATGRGTTWEPNYVSRSGFESERVAEHTDHYAGGRYLGRTTEHRQEMVYGTRTRAEGMASFSHSTIRLEFEDVENHGMTIASPFWARRGDLVYVACHRGVGTTVYELYSPEKDLWHVVHKDVAKPVRLEIPVLVGAAVFVLQTFVLHMGDDRYPALYAGIGCLAAMLVHRQWRSVMIRVSHHRAGRLIRKLLVTDAANASAIKERISQRVRGW